MHKLRSEKSSNKHVGTNTQLFQLTRPFSTASHHPIHQNCIDRSFQHRRQYSGRSKAPTQPTMSKHLLSIITPRRHPHSPSGTQGGTDESHQHQSVRGSVTRMGMMLSQSFHNTLMITHRGSPKTPGTIGRTAHEITPSTTQSPVRTRKNVQSAVSNPSDPSPRRGAKSKQRRVEIDDYEHAKQSMSIEQWQEYQSTGFGFHGKPSTEFMGWRRLLPNEILHLEEGDFFLLSIPPCIEDDRSNKLRKGFIDRILADVIQTKQFFFPDNGKSVYERAIDYINEHNGLIRNGQLYLEFACVVQHYPHREDYISQCLSEHEIISQVQKGGGLDIIVLDYPHASTRGFKRTTLLQWNEICVMQIFIEFRRGDPFPKIVLSRRNAEHHYSEELHNMIELVKDDPLATTKLALEFEKQRSRIMTMQIKKIRSKDEQSDSDLDILRQFTAAVREEVEHSKLQHFSHKHNQHYKDAWYEQYTKFQSLDRLLSPEIADIIYEDIKHSFPLHYEVIHSLRNQRIKNVGTLRKIV
jgi:hypothetical protein